MKHFFTFIAIVLCSFAYAQQRTAKSVHQFSVTDITGKEFRFSDLKGKKVMIVNTASKCGLTPQYEALEALYKKYKDNNFVIVAFPSNDFKEQEPASNQEIAEFCKVNYGVTFPLMEKISVTGEKMHPLYQFLTQKSKNGVEDAPVQWNFQKFLINPDGTIYMVVPPKTQPNSKIITDWIEII